MRHFGATVFLWELLSFFPMRFALSALLSAQTLNTEKSKVKNYQKILAAQMHNLWHNTEDLSKRGQKATGRVKTAMRKGFCR